MNDLSSFISRLSSYQQTHVYNPWRDFDENYDIPNAPAIRQSQLYRYMERRIGKAKVLLVAEACGYQGGHFSGVAMTCERMLLNLHPLVNARMALNGPAQRTSRSDSPLIAKSSQREKGFNEPTATVVWSACLEAGLSPDDFILWNIFPFHPYKGNNLLTNRTPTEEELSHGLPYTKSLLNLSKPLLIFAIGKKSETVLQTAGIPAIGLRHPANGGARIFHDGLLHALTTYFL